MDTKNRSILTNREKSLNESLLKAYDKNAEMSSSASSDDSWGIGSSRRIRRIPRSNKSPKEKIIPKPTALELFETNDELPQNMTNQASSFFNNDHSKLKSEKYKNTFSLPKDNVDNQSKNYESLSDNDNILLPGTKTNLHFISSDSSSQHDENSHIKRLSPSNLHLINNSTSQHNGQLLTDRVINWLKTISICNSVGSMGYHNNDEVPSDTNRDSSSILKPRKQQDLQSNDSNVAIPRTSSITSSSSSIRNKKPAFNDIIDDPNGFTQDTKKRKRLSSNSLQSECSTKNKYSKDSHLENDCKIIDNYLRSPSTQTSDKNEFRITSKPTKSSRKSEPFSFSYQQKVSALNVTSSSTGSRNFSQLELTLNHSLVTINSTPRNLPQENYERNSFSNNFESNFVHETREDLHSRPGEPHEREKNFFFENVNSNFRYEQYKNFDQNTCNEESHFNSDRNFSSEKYKASTFDITSSSSSTDGENSRSTQAESKKSDLANNNCDTLSPSEAHDTSGLMTQISTYELNTSPITISSTESNVRSTRHIITVPTDNIEKSTSEYGNEADFNSSTIEINSDELEVEMGSEFIPEATELSKGRNLSTEDFENISDETLLNDVFVHSYFNTTDQTKTDVCERDDNNEGLYESDPNINTNLLLPNNNENCNIISTNDENEIIEISDEDVTNHENNYRGVLYSSNNIHEGRYDEFSDSHSLFTTNSSHQNLSFFSKSLERNFLNETNDNCYCDTISPERQSSSFFGNIIPRFSEQFKNFSHVNNRHFSFEANVTPEKHGGSTFVTERVPTDTENSRNSQNVNMIAQYMSSDKTRKELENCYYNTTDETNELFENDANNETDTHLNLNRNIIFDGNYINNSTYCYNEPHDVSSSTNTNDTYKDSCNNETNYLGIPSPTSNTYKVMHELDDLSSDVYTTEACNNDDNNFVTCNQDGLDNNNVNNVMVNDVENSEEVSPPFNYQISFGYRIGTNTNDFDNISTSFDPSFSVRNQLEEYADDGDPVLIIDENEENCKDEEESTSLTICQNY